MSQEVSKPTTNLSDFLVCQAQNCIQSVSIYHNSHFRDLHYDLVNNKKATHKSISFRDSIQYLNFLSIYRINYILQKKLKETLKGLQCNTLPVIQSALFSSPVFRELFNESDQAIYEYIYVCQIHQGVALDSYEHFSSEFCTALSALNEKTLNKIYKQLCSYSPEWSYLNLQFNYASGINSNLLEQFINRQIQYLINYSTKSGSNFDIKGYVKIRSSSTDHYNDPYYYSPQFVTFLTQKYEKNASEQSIFNLMEYYLNFWQYFFVVIDTNKNTSKYFEEEIGFYKQYEIFSAEQKIEQSFLAFRMWRINRKVSTYFPSLKNPFFLETFIYSFIQYLIEKKLFAPDLERIYDFREYSAFLHDYVKYVGDKQQQFNFGRYNEYFEFRKISQRLQDNLKKNKEIVYDKKYFLEYAHNQFAEGNKIGIKKYKKYQEKRSSQDEQKDRAWREQVNNLREQLLGQEKQLFYTLVFSNFVNEVSGPKSPYKLNKESYQFFKQNLFATFDESYIQTMEAQYRHSLQAQQAGERKPKEERTETSKEKVKEEINTQEEHIADLINQQQRSQAQSSEEQNDIIQNCPCCKGNPYECEQPDCKILGCCSACMLDV